MDNQIIQNKMRQRQSSTSTTTSNKIKNYPLLLNSKYINNKKKDNQEEEEREEDEKEESTQQQPQGYSLNNGIQDRNKNKKERIENNLIEIEGIITFIGGSWNKYENKEKIEFYISTSFILSSLSIISSTGIDYITMITIGIQSLQVLCVEEEDELSIHPNNNNKNNNHLHQLITSNKNTKRKQIIDVLIPITDIQYLNFHTPWPCSHLELSMSSIDGDFLSILKISTYCNAMPSSMSTPIISKV